MRYLAFALSFCFGIAAFGQTPKPRMSDTQAISALNALSQHMARLQPMLEEVRVKEWVAKGAPDAYVPQLAQTNSEIRGIENQIAQLAQNPEQMQDSMRALFRVQSLHIPLDSLMAGLRKYQNPALADLIQSVAAEDETQVAQLETWILQLAADKDQQYQIVDNEAQRCRATLSRQPASRAKAAPNQ